MLVVLVCGSRYWTNRERIGHRLSLLAKDTTVIHGAAPGADTLAGEEASALGLAVVAIPANWKLHGKAAGPLRNNKMLDLLIKARAAGHNTLVIAFHDDPDLGSGTKDMVQKARNHGFTVEIWN